tara:strand:- start:332 stop:568 length:237 start_codon:yes stop_codon:yes gene_type:complete
MKYQVGIKIYNSFEVEADSEEEAEQKVRELDVYETLDDCDFNITYVDQIRDIPKEMCNDLLRTINGRVICDDEHGNSL